MAEVGIITAITAMIAELGIIGGLFVIMFLIGGYMMVKILPDAIRLHFSEIGKMQDKFSANLETISTKFVASLDAISKEHERHYDKLQDIHNDIKLINKK